MLPYALAYARKLWRVMPLYWMEGDICACGNPECSSPGKHPLLRHGVHEASCIEDQIRAWWERWPIANIGLATGNTSGFWVLDIDAKSGGPDAFMKACREHGGQPGPTIIAVTGGGGRHVLWRTWGEVVRNMVGVLKGVDVRGDGGYIVAPPSVHKSGNRYSWHPKRAPGKVKMAEAPSWVVEMVQDSSRPKHKQWHWRHDSKKPHVDVAAVPAMAEGERNRGLFKLVCRWIWEERQGAEVLELAHEANAHKCRPPLPEHEVEILVQHATRRYA